MAIRMAKIKIVTLANAGEDAEKLFIHCWWEWKMVQVILHNSLAVFCKAKYATTM